MEVFATVSSKSKPDLNDGENSIGSTFGRINHVISGFDNKSDDIGTSMIYEKLQRTSMELNSQAFYSKTDELDTFELDLKLVKVASSVMVSVLQETARLHDILDKILQSENLPIVEEIPRIAEPRIHSTRHRKRYSS